MSCLSTSVSPEPRDAAHLSTWTLPVSLPSHSALNWRTPIPSPALSGNPRLSQIIRSLSCTVNNKSDRVFWHLTCVRLWILQWKLISCLAVAEKWGMRGKYFMVVKIEVEAPTGFGLIWIPEALQTVGLPSSLGYHTTEEAHSLVTLYLCCNMCWDVHCEVSVSVHLLCRLLTTSCF